MKPRAGDEVRVTQGNRVYIGRMLGTAGTNGSTRYVVRSTHSELIHATGDEVQLERREESDTVRASVLRGAVRLGGVLPKRISDDWRRRLGLL